MTSCAACVVALRAGTKAAFSMTSGLKGQMPVLRKALQMIAGVNAFAWAHE